MSGFVVEEELIDNVWTVVIHRGGELAGVGQGVTVEAARMDAVNDMQISDFIEFERQNHREFWMGLTFGTVLVIMVVLLIAWQVLT